MVTLSSDAMDLPRPFGPYTLLRRLAVGGMAEVYVAKAKGIGGFEKLVAIKVIHPRYSEDEHFVRMLVEEAKITVQLTHVNIAQIFDLGCIDGTYCIVMEYIEGADCYRILKRIRESKTPLPLEICAYIVSEVCNGLDYAHRKRDTNGRPLAIVHRDISPQNVLISFAGETKLVDFGIAKAALRTAQTEAGVIKGKYYYMSPEQAWADPMDHRSDVFSTGVLLHELLTGEMLYKEDNLPNLLDKVRKAEIDPPSTRRTDVAAELDRIVMKALAKRPEDRFQSAHRLGQALTQFLYKSQPSFTSGRLATMMATLFPQEASRHTSTVKMPSSGNQPLSAESGKTADSTLPPDPVAVLPAMRPEEFVPDPRKSAVFDLGDEDEDDRTRQDIPPYRRAAVAGPMPPPVVGNVTKPLAEPPVPRAAAARPSARAADNGGAAKRAAAAAAPPAVEAPEPKPAAPPPAPAPPPARPRPARAETPVHRSIANDEGDEQTEVVGSEWDEDEETIVHDSDAPTNAWDEQTLVDQDGAIMQQWEQGDAARAQESAAQSTKPLLPERARSAPAPRLGQATAPPHRPPPVTPPRSRREAAGPIYVPASTPPAADARSSGPFPVAPGGAPMVTPMPPDARSSGPPRSPSSGAVPAAPPSSPPRSSGPPVGPSPWMVAAPPSAPAPAPAPEPLPPPAAPVSSWPPAIGPAWPHAPPPPTASQRQIPTMPPHDEHVADPFVAQPIQDNTAGYTQAMAARRRLWLLLPAGAALIAVGAILAAVLLRPSAPDPELEVISVPPGASVALDGLALNGVTPLRVTGGLEPARPCRVDVTLRGYEPWSSTFEPAHGLTKQIAVLTPQRATLRIETEPAGALVWIDGVLHGNAPLGIPNLPIGRDLDIRLTMPDHADASRPVRISADNLQPVVRVRMSPLQR